MDNLNLNVESLFDEIQSGLKFLQDESEILSLCLGRIIEILQGERGFIILNDKAQGTLAPYAVHNVDADILLEGEAISQTILNEALKAVKPIVLTDAMRDPQFSDTTSVVLSGLRSVLCVPIRSNDGIYGVIYVDNRLRTSAFKKEHLAFLSGCAEKISAIIVQYCPGIKSMPRENLKEQSAEAIKPDDAAGRPQPVPGPAHRVPEPEQTQRQPGPAETSPQESKPGQLVWQVPETEPRQPKPVQAPQQRLVPEQSPKRELEIIWAVREEPNKPDPGANGVDKM